MPGPFQIFNQSDYLIQVVDINSHTEWQTVQIQISWLLQKPTDLDPHCKSSVYRGSARQGLIIYHYIMGSTTFMIKEVAFSASSSVLA